MSKDQHSQNVTQQLEDSELEEVAGASTVYGNPHLSKNFVLDTPFQITQNKPNQEWSGSTGGDDTP